MPETIRRPSQMVDHDELARLFPPPPEYFTGAWLDEPDEIDRKKLARLQRRAVAAYEIPFHRDRWKAAGVSPQDLVALSDVGDFPTYDVDDIRASIDAHPPLGNYQGADIDDLLANPLRIHSSGGTTGKQRPTLYTAWDREAGALLMARGLYLQGVRPGDTVLNSWSYGLHNGAFIFDEAVWGWLNCLVITTSTGNVTSTRKQVELARDYGASAILTTGPYMVRLAEEAAAMGLDLRKDLKLTCLPMNVGSEEAVEELYGMPVLRSYGFHEVQTISSECPARKGLHIFEDAFHAQVVDPETGEELPDGELGSLVITEMYKTGSAQFRYNTLDLAALMPREQCECGSWQRRMTPFAGRADNMVKLRGVNVWPEGVGALVADVDGASSEYFVTARRDGVNESLTASITVASPEVDPADLKERVARHLHQAFGIVIEVEVLSREHLDQLTELATSPKPKRFGDLR
ncbi:phenylacetate--CoA ligase family protein [Nocardioides sp. Bht2]|uniref:phenylacetate--CoA ligase family protein n=1 Tax=Nocardioides sp. Bht2 TaxID=3392297 RepID=UPI0039B43D6D